MHGNVKTMNNIKDKLEILMKLPPKSEVIANPNIDLPPVESEPRAQIGDAPEFVPNPERLPDSRECPAIVPYGQSNAQYLMNDLIDQWDFRVSNIHFSIFCVEIGLHLLEISAVFLFICP